MAKPPTSDIGAPDLGWGVEYGTGLLSEWWETTADLIFPQSMITYGRMRHDLQIKAVNSAYILPLLRANWMLDPEGCKDEVVQHCSDDLGIGILGEDKKPGPARRRGIIWQRHLLAALGKLTYGFTAFERRYEPQPDGYMRLIHLGQRPPWTIASMDIGSDGVVKAIRQTTQEKPIPASRLVWYVTGQEGANWAGISPLRSAFGAWLLKHEAWRVHATSIRRFGMGVPSVEAPEGASAQQVAYAQQLASAMRAGDQAGMGLPAGFKAALMGMSGGTPDAMGWIKYLDTAIAKSALAGLLELGQTETGSRALGESFLDLFFLSLQAVADELALTATSGHEGMPGIVTDLVDTNWGEDEPAPRIVCTDIGENHEATAGAIESLLSAGAITQDPALEEYVRKTWRLPARKGPQPAAQPPPSQPRQPPPQPPGAPQAPGATPPKPQGPQNQGPQPPKPPQPNKPQPAASVTAARDMSPAEVAAGFNPGGHDAQWQTQLDNLMSAYRAVWSEQKAELTDEAEQIAAAGRGRLALTPPPAGRGPDVILAAMRAMARESADATLGEAMSQGVVIDPGRVKIDDARLARIASARASLAASYMAQQASQAFLHIAAAEPAQQQQVSPAEAAAAVATLLDTLSDSSLRDMLGAALTAAQNTGRIAVFVSAPKNVPVHYVASEILDKNTCRHCANEDGQVFQTLAEAEAAYPMGGFRGCEGFARCRGTVVALWGNQASGSPPPPKGDPRAAGADLVQQALASVARWKPDLHPRKPDGEFMRKGGLTPKGRAPVQTPSEFRHPVTGHLMGKTETGDTYEALFASKGAHLLSAKYGGPYRIVAHSEGRARQTPLDFTLDHKHAGELKTLNRRARNQKTAIKAAEARRKNEAAAADGMSPLLVVQVVDPDSGEVNVYAHPGFVSRTTKAMQHLGSYSYSSGDFQKAQEATGHWAQQAKRARAQGVSAAAAEPGDTIIELRNGVPWIGTEGVSAAKHHPHVGWKPSEHPRWPEGGPHGGEFMKKGEVPSPASPAGKYEYQYTHLTRKTDAREYLMEKHGLTRTEANSVMQQAESNPGVPLALLDKQGNDQVGILSFDGKRWSVTKPKGTEGPVKPPKGVPNLTEEHIQLLGEIGKARERNRKATVSELQAAANSLDAQDPKAAATHIRAAVTHLGSSNAADKEQEARLRAMAHRLAGTKPKGGGPKPPPVKPPPKPGELTLRKAPEGDMVAAMGGYHVYDGDTHVGSVWQDDNGNWRAKIVHADGTYSASSHALRTRREAVAEVKIRRERYPGTGRKSAGLISSAVKPTGSAAEDSSVTASLENRYPGDYLDKLKQGSYQDVYATKIRALGGAHPLRGDQVAYNMDEIRAGREVGRPLLYHQGEHYYIVEPDAATGRIHEEAVDAFMKAAPGKKMPAIVIEGPQPNKVHDALKRSIDKEMLGLESDHVRVQFAEARAKIDAGKLDEAAQDIRHIANDPYYGREDRTRLRGLATRIEKAADPAAEAQRAALRAKEAKVRRDCAEAAKRGARVTEQMFGTGNQFNGTVHVAKNFGYAGAVDWDGKMDLQTPYAEGISEIVTGSHPTARPRDIQVLLHELVHMTGRKGMTRRDAYDYMTGHGKSIEEGFTELGSWYALPDFLKRMKLDKRETAMLVESSHGGMPEGRRLAETNVRFALGDARLELNGQWMSEKNRVRSDAMFQLTDQISKARLEIATDHVTTRAQELAKQLQDSGWVSPNTMQKLWDALHQVDKTPPLKRQLLGELAQNRADHINPGQELPYGVVYQEYVNHCLRAMDSLARKQGTRPNTISWMDQIRENVHQISAAGGGDNKRMVMARQLLDALGVSPDLYQKADPGRGGRTLQRDAADWIASAWEPTRKQGTDPLELATDGILKRTGAKAYGT